MEWELADYDRVLGMFGVAPCVNIRESKVKFRELNLNLYDLLDWIRNPDTAARPERFINVRALAEYSFTHNKVFPFWHAVHSRIAHPFLRRLGEHYRYRRTKRPRTFVVVSPVTDATKTESSSEAAAAAGGQTSSPKDRPSPSAEQKLASTAEGGSTETTTVAADQVKDDEEEVADTDGGASLFTLSETEASAKGIRVPTKRRRAFKRRMQDKAVLPSGGQVAITASQ